MSVVVIGGGVAGLTCAHVLHLGVDGHGGGRDVVLLEGGSRVGGKLRSESWQGGVVDLGADAFLARHPRGVALARRIGLGDQLTTPVTSSAHVWTERGLRPLPKGTVVGIPTDPRALADSGVLGVGAMARAAAEPLVRRTRRAGDRSVADVVAEAYGRAVVDEVVEPLLGGVYAGRADRLSIAATIPPLAEAVAAGGSLTRRLAEHRARVARPDDAPVFHGLAGGMATLTQRLAEQLGPDRVRTKTAVTGITGTPGAWQVHTEDEVFDAEAVVLATPADVTADLLTDIARPAAAEVAAIRYASVVVVMLAYAPEADAELVPGSGMLVPRTRGTLTKAATFVSRKWAERGGGHVLVRASVGRIDDDRWRGLSPDELATRVDAEIRWATGIARPAEHRLVVPWESALPQYDVGHVERVHRARHLLPDGIHLTGAAYDGVGVAPCIASAERTALSIP